MFNFRKCMFICLKSVYLLSYKQISKYKFSNACLLFLGISIHMCNQFIYIYIVYLFINVFVLTDIFLYVYMIYSQQPNMPLLCTCKRYQVTLRAAYQHTQLLGWLAHLRYLHEATSGDVVMGIMGLDMPGI